MSTPGGFSRRIRPHPPVQGSHLLFGHHPRKIESFRRGYPRVSAFMDSERKFVMFRHFGRLHARLLLHKQDQLAEIENQLEQIDMGEPIEFFLASNRQDPSQERRALLDQAEKKLKEYNKLMVAYYQNIERPKPTESNVKSVSNWMDGTKPLVAAESGFLNDWDDLRSPRDPADHSGIDVFLGNLAATLTKRGFAKLFTHAVSYFLLLSCPLLITYTFLHVKDEFTRSEDKHILLYRQPQILAASRFLTTIFAVLSLTIPIVVLYNITSTAVRLVVLIIFTAIFSSISCWLTESRNYEILAATAAYCAVMVVFVGNL
ncbi:hypothetical protein F4803DRAFT_22247 [Xylaria telfairii]|nr:hypothetical protein F4803DRAFT_22247 [Xylaria telfairii]